MIDFDEGFGQFVTIARCVIMYLYYIRILPIFSSYVIHIGLHHNRSNNMNDLDLSLL
jgi:hypothetical protein